MKIGFVGLGKLGLPCALAVAMKGHDVMGYDIQPTLMNKEPRTYREMGPDGEESLDRCLRESSIRFGPLEEVVAHSDIVLVAVQTPHEQQYEGVTRLPATREDFDYRPLKRSIEEISACAKRETIVAILSTVLPGTIQQSIQAVAESHLRLCYNPQFVAMGSVMPDFLDPEFVLIGADDPVAAGTIEAFYKSVTSAQIFRMSIASAELTKVAYNTFIGMKVVFANTLMEISHKLPDANVDDVTRALQKADRRLIGPRYLNGGMGDGGGCHPRDNIAMSWLARRLRLSHDLFEDVMIAREEQTEWLADLMCSYDLPKAIIGYTFKGGTNLTTGSSALLLKSILLDRGLHVFMYDRHAEGIERDLTGLEPHVFLIGARHPEHRSLRFPEGSVVIDPWRYLDRQEGVTLVPLGISPSF